MTCQMMIATRITNLQKWPLFEIFPCVDPHTTCTVILLLCSDNALVTISFGFPWSLFLSSAANSDFDQSTTSKAKIKEAYE